MKSLYKLDLDPNEIYNVSLNIKQGNKTVDNLRFFQTRVPKLFNISPSSFSTYSQIIEQPDPIVRTQSGGGITGGGGVTLNVTSISWTETKTGDFSEGELTSEPSQVTYNFTINLDGYPKMMGYEVAGFEGNLSFLNYRNDYKPSGKSLKLSLTLSQIDPTAERKVLNAQTVKEYDLASAIAKGDTRLKLSGTVKGLVPGNTLAYVYIPKTGGGSKSAFPIGTTVSGYTPGTNYVSLSQPAVSAAAATYRATFVSNAKFNGFSGTIYEYLKGGDTKTTASGNVASATFKYQTFPTYTAPTYTYKFGQNSFIKSSIINPNVLESLVWEDTVRDFIFFTIADSTVPSKKYFFGTYGTITPATQTAAVTGTSLFSINNPPTAPESVTNAETKSFVTSTPKIQFYDSGIITQSSETSPDLKRKVEVRFAIARYNKVGSTWKGQWLGTKSTAPSEKEILSSPEVLE